MWCIYTSSYSVFFALYSTLLLSLIIKAPEKHFLYIFSVPLALLVFLTYFVTHYFVYLLVAAKFFEIYFINNYIRNLHVTGKYGVGYKIEDIGDHYWIAYFYPIDKQEYLSKLHTSDNGPWSHLPWTNSMAFAFINSLRLFHTIVMEILPLDAIKNTEIAAELNGKSIPFLFFSHGLMSNHTVYSSLQRQLASYGIVCASIVHKDGTANVYTDLQGVITYGDKRNQPGSTFFEYLRIKREKMDFRMNELDRVFNYLEENVTFVTGTKQVRLLVEDLILMGHSNGGLTGLRYTAENNKRRVKTLVTLDPWLEPYVQTNPDYVWKIEVPLLTIISKQFYDIPEFNHYPERIDLLFEENEKHTNISKLYIVPKTNHVTATDMFVFFPFFMKISDKIDVEDPVDDLYWHTKTIADFLLECGYNLEGVQK